MSNTNNVLKAVANGEECVNALTHTSRLGNPAEVKDALMLLVARGILESYDDGRRVRLA